MARQSGVGMVLQEQAIPIREEVAAACELLGLDPLYLANEGKLIAICPGDRAEQLLETMRRHPLGGQSAIIGQVVEDPYTLVQMETRFGGSRLVDWLAGDPLPRIC
jgi:hydrogenase expression/formation protein HypE